MLLWNFRLLLQKLLKDIRLRSLAGDWGCWACDRGGWLRCCSQSLTEIEVVIIFFGKSGIGWKWLWSRLWRGEGRQRWGLDGSFHLATSRHLRNGSCR